MHSSVIAMDLRYDNYSQIQQLMAKTPAHPLQLRRFLDSNDYTITMITFQLLLRRENWEEILGL